MAEPSSQDVPAVVLGDAYVLGEVVDAGSSAEVYEVTDLAARDDGVAKSDAVRDAGGQDATGEGAARGDAAGEDAAREAEVGADVPAVVLGGRYALGDVLGTGASATVYEATDLAAHENATGDDAAREGVAGDDAASDETARVVVPSARALPAPGPGLAMKVLHAHLTPDPEARAAFLGEARSAARVQHPGLVSVLDVGQDEIAGEAVVWILMRRAPGVPLADALASGPLDISEALGVAARVLDALTAAHLVGLVHRDVSPRNVMVELMPGMDRVRTVTLLDLGLAEVAPIRVPIGAGRVSVDRGAVGLGKGEPGKGKPGAVGPAKGKPGVAEPAKGELGAARAVRMVAGSVVTMSPEQARGLPLDARSDVYAVGALLYLALTGHAPFERPHPRAVMQAHVQAPVPVPSARRMQVPSDVDRLVSRAMAKSPGARFQTAEEMRDAILRLLVASRGAGSAEQANTRTTVLPAAGRGSSPAAQPFGRTTVLPAAVMGAPAPGTPAYPVPWVPTASVPVPWVPAATVRVPLDRAAAGRNVSLRPAGRDLVAVPAPEPWGTRTGTVALLLVVVVALIGVGWVVTRNDSADALPHPAPSALSVRSTAPAVLAPATPSATLTDQPTSTGPTTATQVDVPRLASLDLTRARVELETLGLVLGKVRLQDSPGASGIVLASDPSGGRVVPAGTVVTLTVASGSNAVPAVSGHTRSAAVALVGKAGFSLRLLARPDPNVPAGAVIGTEPTAGTSARIGSLVVVLVSDGPAAVGPDNTVPPGSGGSPPTDTVPPPQPSPTDTSPTAPATP